MVECCHYATVHHVAASNRHHRSLDDAHVSHSADPAADALDIAAGVAIFLVGELLLSRLLFKAHLRDEPY